MYIYIEREMEAKTMNKPFTAMSNLQINYCSKLDFQNVAQHTNG